MKPNHIASLMAVVFFVLTANVSAKVVNPADAAKNKAADNTNQNSNQTLDKSVNAVQNSLKGLFKKKGKTTNDTTQSKQSTNKVATGNPATGNQDQPALESYSKNDFKPGEKVIFYEDFSNTAFGDFPSEWNTNGSAEIVTTYLFPGKWLKFVLGGYNAMWTDDRGSKNGQDPIEYGAAMFSNVCIALGASDLRSKQITEV